MKKAPLFLVPVILAVLIFSLQQKQPLLNPLVKSTPKPKPLLAYTFNNLRKTEFPQSLIILGRKVSETPDFLTQMFYWQVPVNQDKNITKRVSGILNLPKQPGEYPLIVMFRGYAPKENYHSGIGTERSAFIFAQNGFITLALDFLGYGESDISSPDGLEDRFQTYTTALTLLSSLPTLNSALEASYSGKIKADVSKTGIWGHSNGGQIALSVLAISGEIYPAVLWAPVSKAFPYSILYYTDETDDQGRMLRKALANFEQDYEAELFSPPKFYRLIKAPIEIHQGVKDQEVPFWWSDELVESLKKNGIKVTYIKYSGADHNLMPDGWSSAVAASISFYSKHFK